MHIVARYASRIFEHLVQGALPHVEHGVTLHMPRSDFLVRIWGHRHTSVIMAATIVDSGVEKRRAVELD